jgi:hypothetical protein
LLYSLAEAGGEASLDELARSVAASENDTPRSEITDSQRRQVFIPLYQMHVPKLEDAGVVAFDSETGLVRLIDVDRIFEPIVRPQPKSRRWYRYYIGWSLTGISITLVTWFGAVPPSQAVWTVFALVFVSGMIILASLQHWLDGTQSSR